jgi:polygalacturonase
MKSKAAKNYHHFAGTILFLLFICMMRFFFASPHCQAAEIDVTSPEFGAVGSDSEADAVAIQKALDMAKNSSETVTVTIPSGNYYLDRWLRIYSNTHLVLDQNATLYRTDAILDKPMLKNVDANDSMYTIGGYDMSENITIEGGTWDGGDTENATDNADLIRINHAQNITIKNCTIKNVYDCHLLELVAVKHGVISGCTLTGFTYNKDHKNDWTYAREAIQLETAWTNNENDLEDQASAWANGIVIDGTVCDDITVSNNKILEFPCGVGQHHYTESGAYRNTNITIKNNTITCSAKWKHCKTAITCGGMNKVKISGNRIKGPYRFAIHVTESNDVTLQKNKIQNITNTNITITKIHHYPHSLQHTKKYKENAYLPN